MKITKRRRLFLAAIGAVGGRNGKGSAARAASAKKAIAQRWANYRARKAAENL